MGEEEGNAFTILSGEWTLSNTPQPPHESHTGGIDPLSPWLDAGTRRHGGGCNWLSADQGDIQELLDRRVSPL